MVFVGKVKKFGGRVKENVGKVNRFLGKAKTLKTNLPHEFLTLPTNFFWL